MRSATSHLSDYTIFVGAGISVDSGCPLFKDFWLAFLKAGLAYAKLPDSHQLASDASRLMEVFPPEQLLYRLQTAGRPERQSLVSTLLRYLRDGRLPNANHVALSMMLMAGAQVWTTNYDTLIEDAPGDDRFHVIAWPESPQCSCSKPHIMKPHGSFQPGGPDQQHLIFDSAAVLDMRDDWKEAFAQSLAGRHVIVAGQRGQDIDLMPVLMEQAQHEIQSGVWYEFAGENREALKRKVPSFDLPDCDNPSKALQAHCSRLLHESIPAISDVKPPEKGEAVEAVEAVDFPYSHLAAAVILDHFDSPDLVRRELAASIRHDRLALKFMAARRFTRSQVFDNPHISRPAQALSKHLLRIPLRRVSRQAWRLYVLAAMTHVSADVGAEISKAVRRGEAAHWPFPLRVSAASSLKLTGPLGPVFELLPEADLTRQDPSIRGFAVYTLLWTLRNVGDLDGWTKLWDAESASAAMFDPNWAAWIRLEQALFACMLGNGHEALTALQSAEIQFAAKRKRHPLFVFEYDMGLMFAQMLAGERPLTDEPVCEKLKALTGSQLDTPFRRASLQITAASLTQDPVAALPLIEEAERRTPSRLHHALLGQLRLRVAAHGPDVRQLLEENHNLRFGYGEALLRSEFSETALDDEPSDARQLLLTWTKPPALWIVP